MTKREDIECLKRRVALLEQRVVDLEEIKLAVQGIFTPA